MIRIRHYIIPISVIFFLSLHCAYSQVSYSSNQCENELSARERDSLSGFKTGKIVFYRSDGKVKYKEDRSRKKRNISYYNPDGTLCKTQTLHYRTRISRTVFYENGKKVMVCKGTLK